MRRSHLRLRKDSGKLGGLLCEIGPKGVGALVESCGRRLIRSRLLGLHPQYTSLHRLYDIRQSV